MFPGYTVLKFEEVLEGAAGEVEARAAREWLDTGALIQPLPAGLVTTDETGYDTRVVDKDLQKRRRRLSSETIVATQPKQLKRTAATKGEQRPKRKASQQKGGAAGAGKQSAWEGDLYSRAAFVSHGDGIGALARRRARGPRPPRSAAQGELPPGWKMIVRTLHKGPQAGTKYKVFQHVASGKSFGTLAAAQAFWESQGGPAAAAAAGTGGAAAAAAAAPFLGPQDGADHGLPPGWTLVWIDAGEGEGGRPLREPSYVSPEGMVFSEWDEVETWLQTHVQQCPPPEQLLRVLRSSAAAGKLALPAAQQPAGLLGLQRARVALFSQERERAERQAAVVAAAVGGGSRKRGRGGGGGGGAAAAAGMPEKAGAGGSKGGKQGGSGAKGRRGSLPAKESLAGATAAEAAGGREEPSGAAANISADGAAAAQGVTNPAVLPAAQEGSHLEQQQQQQQVAGEGLPAELAVPIVDLTGLDSSGPADDVVDLT